MSNNGMLVVAMIVMLICASMIVIALEALRSSLKAALRELRSTFTDEFLQRTGDREGLAEYRAMVSEAAEVTQGAHAAVTEMRELVTQAHQEYTDRSKALDERERELDERESRQPVALDKERPPVALEVDPKRPPKMMKYLPADGKDEYPRCECHGEVVNPGDSVVWWPDPKITDSVHLFCSRGIADMAQQVGS